MFHHGFMKRNIFIQTIQVSNPFEDKHKFLDKTFRLFQNFSFNPAMETPVMTFLSACRPNVNQESHHK